VAVPVNGPFGMYLAKSHLFYELPAALHNLIRRCNKDFRKHRRPAVSYLLASSGTSGYAQDES
jgi:hypothetical protein